ncbi:MAG: MFS transporter [Planctomycetota bacterium]|nr:MAG: MFS transporter [Planctomycetota bacterium]
MSSDGKAQSIRLADVTSPPMRAFHMAWVAFFVCFFAWFGVAPLMGVVRDELQLTKDQVGWCLIGSVGATILARLAAGWLCDRIGPRLTFSGLLVLGALPVMGIGLARDFPAFLTFRVLIGAIGASFVVTQYHTSRMFAANCVGTANAMAAGWGNLGGGVAQLAMPLLFGAMVGLAGLSESASWRCSMALVGAVCALTGVAYYFLTQDTPHGNYRELRAAGRLPQAAAGGFAEAIRDRRVWALFLIYGASFGMELTIDNIAVLYFLDYFDYFRQLAPEAALRRAGLIAAAFGGMNLFARAAGGWVADRCGNRWGLSGRVHWLFVALFGEGVGLMMFSQATTLAVAIPLMVVFAMFVKMCNGATYAVVPFINPCALGAVSAIVGAGGNVGAVALGFLFASDSWDWRAALFIAGAAVTCISFASFAVIARREPATAPSPVGAPHELAGAV